MSSIAGTIILVFYVSMFFCHVQSISILLYYYVEFCVHTVSLLFPYSGTLLFPYCQFPYKNYERFYFHTVESSISILFWSQPFYFYTNSKVTTFTKTFSGISIAGCICISARLADPCHTNKVFTISFQEQSSFLKEKERLLNFLGKCLLLCQQVYYNSRCLHC